MFERLKEDLDTILERDPAAHGRLEIILCYPGFHALALHRCAHWCSLQGWTTFARWVSHVGRFLTGIEIHPAARIGRRVFIDHGMGTVIGETAEVGDDCTIYHGVTLGGTSLAKGVRRHPTIGRGVVLGSGAQLIGNLTVGDGARIGSNAVVLKAVPAGQTVVGVPAREVVRIGGRHAHHEGFVAYGLATDGRDPYGRDIERLNETVKRQQAVIEALAGRLGLSPEQARLAEPIKEKKAVVRRRATGQKAAAPGKAMAPKKPARTRAVKAPAKASEKVPEKAS